MKPKYFIVLAVVACQLSFTTNDLTLAGKKIVTITSPNAGMVMGSRNVNYGTDHDAITNRSPGTLFTGVYIKVTNAPIKINDMKVYFDNGDKFDISILSNMKQNRRCRLAEIINRS